MSTKTPAEKLLKVRVCYTVAVTDDYRRAIRYRFGQTGMATRSEVAEFLRQNGGTIDDDIMFEYHKYVEAENERKATP